jgi:hypothetical protein
MQNRNRGKKSIDKSNNNQAYHQGKADNDARKALPGMIAKPGKRKVDNIQRNAYNARPSKYHRIDGILQPTSHNRYGIGHISNGPEQKVQPSNHHHKCNHTEQVHYPSMSF